MENAEIHGANITPDHPDHPDQGNKNAGFSGQAGQGSDSAETFDSVGAAIRDIKARLPHLLQQHPGGLDCRHAAELTSAASPNCQLALAGLEGAGVLRRLDTYSSTYQLKP